MISKRIVMARKRKDWIQTQLAEALGVSVDTVRRWEQGKRIPDTAMLQKLAQALDTSTAYLLGEMNDPKRYTSRLLELVGTDGNDSSLITSEHGALGDSEAVARLIYERPNGERLDLPDTPENRELFEKLVVAMMTKSLKEEPSTLPRSGGIARSV